MTSANQNSPASTAGRQLEEMKASILIPVSLLLPTALAHPIIQRVTDYVPAHLWFYTDQHCKNDAFSVYIPIQDDPGLPGATVGGQYGAQSASFADSGRPKSGVFRVRKWASISCSPRLASACLLWMALMRMWEG
ncbi:MAG: hypothetical protein MMC33_003454 [Icmadophila ericetorum]|nr:hypothetical protein [Icmadophila ericetorum]